MVAGIVVAVLYTGDLVVNGSRVSVRDKNRLVSGVITAIAGLGFCLIQAYAWRPDSGERLLGFFMVFVVGCCTIVVQFYKK